MYMHDHLGIDTHGFGGIPAFEEPPYIFHDLSICFARIRAWVRIRFQLKQSTTVIHLTGNCSNCEEGPRGGLS